MIREFQAEKALKEKMGLLKNSPRKGAYPKKR